MIIVLIIFFICSIVYFKRSVLVTSATLMLMPQWSSGIEGIKLSYLIILFQCAYYFLWVRLRKKSICKNDYPLLIACPCLIAGIGYILSNKFGEINNMSISLVNIINYFLYPYVVFKIIKNTEDLLFFLHSFFNFMLVVCAYAVIEAIFRQNFISNYATEFNLVDGIMGTEEVGERFGFVRCSSILSYSSALGMTSATTFFVFLYVKSKNISIGRVKERLMLFLLPFCVLLSGTRSQMIVFVICVIPFFFFKEFKRTKTYRALVTLGGIALVTLGSLFLTILNSIIHSDKASMGSSSEMRMEQLEICLAYMSSSPWLGHGKNYMWEYVRPDNPALLGAESVWFQLIVDYGLLGCLTYLFVIAGLMIWLYKFDKVLCFLPLAFLVGKTVSIVIGIELNYVIITSIVLMKISMFTTVPLKWTNRSLKLLKFSLLGGFLK